MKFFSTLGLILLALAILIPIIIHFTPAHPSDPPVWQADVQVQEEQPQECSTSHCGSLFVVSSIHEPYWNTVLPLNEQQSVLLWKGEFARIKVQPHQGLDSDLLAIEQLPDKE